MPILGLRLTNRNLPNKKIYQLNYGRTFIYPDGRYLFTSERLWNCYQLN